MNVLHHLAALVAAIGIVWLSPAARADEASGLGISLDGYAAPVWDDSVTSMTAGQAQDRSRGLVGVATLANLGPYAAGGVVDGFPGIFGGGRMTVGGMAGWQPRVGTHRFQVLGEIGAERFSDVGGNFFASPSVHETWLDYVGARLGTSETFSAAGHFELGAWFFVRKDLGQATVSNSSYGSEGATEYRLGGYSAGAALRVGLRFDQRRAPSESPADFESAGI
ncbi:MAG TPA: hypothetical protein VKQ32_11655 [Polyangia bacterium]|nr:hypothetical protein [Polyangia bacterium]